VRIELNWLIGLVTALVLPASIANAGEFPEKPQVGDTYELRLTRRSVQQSSDGSAGSSNDEDTIVEQVTAVRGDGLELQYDLPTSATAAERARTWQFPVRVFKPSGAPAQVLNSPELETRLDAWLQAASLSRTACGSWVLSWNAFRIECEPQSVIKALQPYDLGTAIPREGELYQDSESGSSGTLARSSGGLDGEIFTVEMHVNPDAVRRARAESDVVVGAIVRKSVSLEAALRERAGERVAGTISVVIETDPAGNVHRRTKVTKLDIQCLDGHSELQTITETLQRRRISRRD
jgi:hypothetical protein